MLKNYLKNNINIIAILLILLIAIIVLIFAKSMYRFDVIIFRIIEGIA